MRFNMDARGIEKDGLVPEGGAPRLEALGDSTLWAGRVLVV